MATRESNQTEQKIFSLQKVCLPFQSRSRHEQLVHYVRFGQERLGKNNAIENEELFESGSKIRNITFNHAILKPRRCLGTACARQRSPKNQR
jgi:hypothetical protein